MTELLTEFKPEIISTIKFFTLPFFVFIISMAHVYIWGRMLNIVENYRIKNTIALFTIIGSYTLYYFVMNKGYSLESLWYAILYGSVTIIMYVLLGFKLYDRLDNKLDNLFKSKKKIKK